MSNQVVNSSAAILSEWTRFNVDLAVHCTVAWLFAFQANQITSNRLYEPLLLRWITSPFTSTNSRLFSVVLSAQCQNTTSILTVSASCCVSTQHDPHDAITHQSRQNVRVPAYYFYPFMDMQIHTLPSKTVLCFFHNTTQHHYFPYVSHLWLCLFLSASKFVSYADL